MFNQITIKNEQDIYDVIDLLHTRVIDSLGEDSQLLPVLEKTLEELDELV